MELSINEINPKHLGLIDKYLNYFNNWGTTDWFCFRVIQPLLNKYPKDTLELIMRWNLSENLWKRRASIVSFTRKIVLKGNFIDQIFQLCNNLIWDEEDLIKKAVGWVLRDNMYQAKERIVAYIKTLRKEGVSAKIISSAIQNLSSDERAKILKIQSVK